MRFRNPFALRRTLDECELALAESRSEVGVTRRRHHEELRAIELKAGGAVRAIVETLVGIEPRKDEYGYRIITDIDTRMMDGISRLGESRQFEYMSNYVSDQVGAAVARKLQQLGMSGIRRAAQELEDRPATCHVRRLP